MNPSELGDRLRQVRRQLGLTQLEVAVRGKIQPSVYCRVETGTGNPTLATLNAICRGLGTTLTDLLVMDLGDNSGGESREK